MSEKIKEIRDGSFLCVNEEGKAYWGQPEGYPQREILTIEWDGNTEGMEGVANTYYYVSDAILSDEQIKAGIFVYYDESGESVASLVPWDNLVSMGYITEDIVFIGQVIFVRKDGAVFQGFEFNTAGVYFAGGMGYMKFETKTIRPIAIEFLPTAASVSYVHSNPTAADYNALLTSLYAAGYIGAIYPPWTQSNITSGDFPTVAYANDIWVAGGYNQGLYYSTDGQTWTQSNITSGSFNTVAYANGFWVSGSYIKGLYYSTDGQTWTQSDITSGHFNTVAYANGLWVACSGSNEGLYYSK